MQDRLLTPPEAAAELRVTVDTLKKWRVTKRYPALTFIKRGRSVFYLASVVDAFARQSQAV